MSSYPECDKYECDECPRRGECVDYEPSEPVIHSAEELALEMLGAAISGLEERIDELERFTEGIERMISAVIKARNEEE